MTNLTDANHSHTAAMAKVQKMVEGKITRAGVLMWSAMEYGMPEANLRLREVKITRKGDHNATYTAMVKGWVEGAAFVAFHDADTPVDAMAGILNRMANGQLQLHPDKYPQGVAPPGIGSEPAGE